MKMKTDEQVLYEVLDAYAKATQTLHRIMDTHPDPMASPEALAAHEDALGILAKVGEALRLTWSELGPKLKAKIG